MHQKFKKATKPRERIQHPARKPKHLQWTVFDHFVCGKCQATFTTRFAQSRHLRTFHTEEKERKRQAIK